MNTPCTFCNGHGRPFGHPCPDCSPEYNPEPCTFCNAPSNGGMNTLPDGTDPVPACPAHADTACADCGDPTDGAIVTTDGRFLCAVCADD